MHLLYAALAAFVAGGINAVAGGGTFVTFPTLTALVGLSDKIANVTSTVGLWPGSLAAAVSARDDLRRLPRATVVGYSVVSLAGGGLGAGLLLITPAKTFAFIIPWLLTLATTLFIVSKPLSRRIKARVAAAASASGAAAPPSASHPVAWRAAAMAMHLLVAVYGGYFGAGMGVMILAGLAVAGFEDLHEMNALKVLLAVLINAVACFVFLWGPVDWAIAGVMAAASVAGGFAGMGLAKRISADRLRVLIITIGVTLSVCYFWRAYH